MTALTDDVAATLQAVLGHLQRLDARLDKIEAGIADLRVDIAKIEGRVSQMPTLINLIGITFAIMAGTFGGIGGLLAIAHYLLGYRP